MAGDWTDRPFCVTVKLSGTRSWSVLTVWVTEARRTSETEEIFAASGVWTSIVAP